MFSFPNAKLAAIDNALTELEPIRDEFSQAHGFTLARSQEGSFNVPRRWLRRNSQAIIHEIGSIIASERLERGFYWDITCTLYLAALDRKAHRHYDSRVFESLPFSSLRNSLRRHLADALAKLDACASEFILHSGAHDHAVQHFQATRDGVSSSAIAEGVINPAWRNSGP